VVIIIGFGAKTPYAASTIFLYADAEHWHVQGHHEYTVVFYRYAHGSRIKSITYCAVWTAMTLFGPLRRTRAPYYVLEPI